MLKRARERSGKENGKQVSINKNMVRNIILNTKMNSSEIKQVRKWKDRNCRAQNTSKTEPGEITVRFNSKCTCKNSHGTLGVWQQHCNDFAGFSQRSGQRHKRNKKSPKAPVSDATSTEGLKKTGDLSINKLFLSRLYLWFKEHSSNIRTEPPNHLLFFLKSKLHISEEDNELVHVT